MVSDSVFSKVEHTPVFLSEKFARGAKSNFLKVGQRSVATPSYIRESVDSLCRDDADMPMTPYIVKAYNRPDAAFVSLFR